MMKKVLFVLIGLFLVSVSSSLAANEPYVISFQGKLNPVPSLPPDIIFTLYKDSGATQLAGWEETLNDVPVDSNGIFNVFLGQTQSLDNILINNTSGLWVRVTVDGVLLSPAQALTAAPYAFHAKIADSMPPIYVSNGNVGIGTTAPQNDLDMFKTVNNGSVRANVFNNNASNSDARLRVGATNGGHINLVANNKTTDAVLGIPKGNSGIATEYGNMVFATGTGGVAAERMRINSAGNVGIGTTNPTGGRLEVRNSSGTGISAKSTTAGDGVYGIASYSDKAGVRGHNDAGHGIHGTQGGANPNNYAGVYGSSATGFGVMGYTTGANKAGVAGTGGAGHGVSGTTLSGSHAGVYGLNGYASGKGVMGEASSTNGYGVYGKAINTGGNGVYGEAPKGAGVKGVAPYGVVGISNATSGGYGVQGSSGSNVGVSGSTNSGRGVEGIALLAGTGVYAGAGPGGTALEIGTGRIKINSITKQMPQPGPSLNVTMNAPAGKIQCRTGGTSTYDLIHVINDYVKPDSLIFLTAKTVKGGASVNAYLITPCLHGYNDTFDIKLSRMVDGNNEFDVYFLVIN